MRFLETTELESFTRTGDGTFKADILHDGHLFEDVEFEMGELQEELDGGYGGYTFEGVLSYNTRDKKKRTANVTGAYHFAASEFGDVETEVEIWEEDMNGFDFELVNR